MDMKKTILILAALAGALSWTACQKDLQDPADETRTPDQAERTVTLTLKASKEQPGTKALDLGEDGASLNVYWKDTEKVKVFKDGTCLGTLNVTPGSGEKPLDAVLSGDIAVDGLAVDGELMLLIPRDVWEYTGFKQNIPQAYYTPGHFISMKNISVSKFTIPDNNQEADMVY